MAAWLMGKKIPIKFALAGLPAANTILDTWAQFRYLDDTILGSSWSAFTEVWCYDTGYMGYQKKLKPYLKKSYYKKMRTISVSVKQNEAFDLPPEVDSFVYFKLTGECRRLYTQMEKEFYARYEDVEVRNEMAVTNMLRLQELAGGYLDDGETLVQLNRDRYWAFEDWLVDFPQDAKLVIAYKFTHELHDILEALDKRGRKYYTLYGGTKPKDRKNWIKFQTQSDVTDFVVQIQAGGLGIDLFTAGTCVIYSNSFSYFDYDQLKRRLHRHGQKADKVNFIHFIGENTIDTDVHLSLMCKGQIADDVMNQLRLRRISPNG